MSLIANRVVELESALVAADEELGHQLRRVSALEQECCRITNQLRSALRSAASSERERAAMVSRALSSEAEAVALRQRLEVLRRRPGDDGLHTSSPLSKSSERRNTAIMREDGSTFTATPKASKKSSKAPLHEPSPPASHGASPPPVNALFGKEKLHSDQLPNLKSPVATESSLSYEIRLRRLVIRLEQQLSTERAAHAFQLRQLQAGLDF